MGNSIFPTARGATGNVVHRLDGQFHEERDKVKIKKYGFFHCKLIALTQTVLHVLGKNVSILSANLFS